MRLFALLTSAVVLAGCGAAKTPVEHKVPGGAFTGFTRLFDLPRGYGVRCADAMHARRSGDGGAATLVSDEGVQLVTAALRFSDVSGAERAYAASISPQARRCYADGFAAELERRYRVRVRRVETKPWKIDPIGDERDNARASIVLAGADGDVTVYGDTAVVRIGSALYVNQTIDISAAHPRGAPDLRLVQALA
jgi:hypothetical protein